MLTLRRITRIGEFDRRLKNEFREKYDAFSVIDEEDKESPGIENNYLFIYANIPHTVDQYDSIRAICIDENNNLLRVTTVKQFKQNSLI